MLDDNVRSCYSFELDQLGLPNRTEGYVQPNQCSFFAPMRGIECMVRSSAHDTKLNDDGKPSNNANFDCNQLSDKYKPLQSTGKIRPNGNAVQEARSIQVLHEYSGSSDAYGIIGMQVTSANDSTCV